MNKLNRDINSNNLEQSKNRTIVAVMDEITTTRPKRRFNRNLVLSFSLSMFVLALIFVLNQGESEIISPVSNLEASTIETVSEATYITGNLLALESVTVSNHYAFLNDEETFVFEDDLVEFNKYFDVLKVFLEDNPISAPTVTEYEGEAYQNSIRYTVDGEEYLFNLNIDNDEVEGELIKENIRYTVSGEIEESDNKTKVVLEASNGNNYIHLKYEQENDDEVETKYEIESMINGIKRNKEIKVSFEDDESKVVIEEDESSYELKKEIEDGNVKYKISYEIGDDEGEATISLEEVNGKTEYVYVIKENGKEKEIRDDNPNRGGKKK